MATGSAWVLNLDADLELAAHARRVRYAPTRAVLAAMRPHVDRLAASLLGPGDVRVDETSPEGALRGLPGRAFCPTPRALALLRRAGAEPDPHPAVDVLARVNGRAFAASLGNTIPGAAFVSDLAAAEAMLARDPELVGRDGERRPWRIKRTFGMAGRGQRVVASGALGEVDRAFVRASMAEGGVQIEPDVEIVCERALHGMLAEDGAVRFGRLVTQRCDPHGQWLATEPALDVASELAGALRAEAERVAVALHGAGYFGPFGVDAYTYCAGERVVLQPRSEINARYSMGFAIGFADFA